MQSCTRKMCNFSCTFVAHFLCGPGAFGAHLVGTRDYSVGAAMLCSESCVSHMRVPAFVCVCAQYFSSTLCHHVRNIHVNSSLIGVFFFSCRNGHDSDFIIPTARRKRALRSIAFAVLPHAFRIQFIIAGRVGHFV